MGEMITFKANGGTCPGYLADGGGPGIIVIQEWWGLVPHIESVADRFANEGFTALAPDLYRGTKTNEPDEAGKLLMALNVEQAAKDLSGAVDLLVERTGKSAVGVVGYCMGGGLALVLAAQRPDAVKACAPYYGVIPWPSAQPDWSKIDAKIEGHYAEKDSFFTPDKVRELEAQLKSLGKDVSLEVHPGVDHAFFNDTRPEVYDEKTSQETFARTVRLFHSVLG